MDEEAKHIQAFELYFTLLHDGHTKTSAIKEVSKKLKHSETSLWKWKKIFNWDEQEVIRNVQIKDKITDKTNSTIVENKVTYLSMVHNAIGKYIEDVEAGRREPIEINTSADMVRLITIALSIQDEGEADKPVKLEVENKGKDKDIPDNVVKEFGTFLIHRGRDKDLGTDSG